jgi:uncharacterized delta-60 repeat protein
LSPYKPARLTVETLESRVLLSAGNVDTSFGRGGYTVVQGLDAFTDMAVQSTGKVLVLGETNPRTAGAQSHLLRLNNDGTPDAAFHDPAPGFLIDRLFEQSDDKFYLFGRTGTANQTVARLARYNADGTVDLTFHGGTPVTTMVPQFGTVVSRQSDGKIVLAYVKDQSAGANYALTRLNADGTLDTAFGVNGEAVAAGGVGTPGSLPPRAILFDGEGNIAVIGSLEATSGGDDAPYGVVFGPSGGATAGGGIALPFLSESRFGGPSVYTGGVVRPDETPVVTIAGEDPDPGTYAYVFTGNHALLLDPDPFVTGPTSEGVARAGNAINTGNNTVSIGGIEGREISVTRIAASGEPDATYGFAGVSTPLRVAPRGQVIGTVTIAQAPGGAIVAAGTYYPDFVTDSGSVFIARFTGGAPGSAAGARGPAAALDPIPEFALAGAVNRRTLTFDVKYTAAGGLNPATLDSSDIRVVGPNGFSRLAQFVGLDTFPGADGQYAIYAVRGPGGHWNANDAGDYHIILRSRQVRDAVGHAAPAVEVGEFIFPPAAARASITRSIAPASPAAISAVSTRTTNDADDQGNRLKDWLA